jgi:hypothetical protein
VLRRDTSLSNKLRIATVALAGIFSLVAVLSPGGYMNSVVAQSAGFIETFDSAPATPADYTNPHNWDFMVFGVNERQPNLAQHGPNCEAPGFPYTSTNSHRVANAGNAVFICNNHLMTSPGITGYGAVYMTPPAVADFSAGPATISWDQSTLRTSSRDWVYITLTPFMEHHEMPYLNVDQHIPAHNIRILLGGANTFILSEQVNGQDVRIPQQDDYHTWQDVFHAQTPPLEESPTRRDTFQVTLDQNRISFCMPHYQGFNGDPTFCWARNVQLPQALSPSVWSNQASVQITHVVYNAEKACEDGALANGFDNNTVLDQFSIVHNAYGDANCPPNTWHWDNVSINPAVGYSVIQSSPQDFHTNTGSPTTVQFAQPAPAGAYLSFVSWGDTPQLAVSFNNGANWNAPRFQASTSLAHPEVGENVFMPIPAGQRSIVVRGANGYWGTFEAQAFKIVSPPSGSPSVAPPSAPTSTPTSTPVTPPTATAVPTAAPAAPTPTNIPPSGTTNCPCSLFAANAAPASTSGNDTNSLEIGVKFRADTSGQVTGARFYKLPNNTGTHTGSLWTSTGTLLATATFTGESASGWQQVNFSSPVAISANTSYVVSYHTQGHYAADQNYFANNTVDRGPLHVPTDGQDGDVGLYSYSPNTTMPTNSWNSSNYWVDVVYSSGSTATPPTATPITPPAATPVPTAAPPTNVPAATGLTMFAANAAPASSNGGDTNSVEVGVKFRADTSGRVTGVRFYKLANNTGPHSGSLWTSTGTRLATATFSGESASGWQQVNFSTPVAISANTTYIVSYHTNGHYAADQNFFNGKGADLGPLHALANGVSGSNGVYTYGPRTVFPTNSYQSSNYWVDVVYSSGP